MCKDIKYLPEIRFLISPDLLLLIQFPPPLIQPLNQHIYLTLHVTDYREYRRNFKYPSLSKLMWWSYPYYLFLTSLQCDLRINVVEEKE